MERKKILILVVIGILIITTIPVSIVAKAAPMETQETCPQTGDWNKKDNLTGVSFTYTAPEGFLVAEVCYKAATGVVYYAVQPPQGTVIVVSTVINSGGQVADLSHASFRLVPISEPTATPSSTPTETPESSPTPEETPVVSPTPEETPVVSPTPQSTPTRTPVIRNPRADARCICIEDPFYHAILIRNFGNMEGTFKFQWVDKAGNVLEENWTPNLPLGQTWEDILFEDEAPAGAVGVWLFEPNGEKFFYPCECCMIENPPEGLPTPPTGIFSGIIQWITDLFREIFR